MGSRAFRLIRVWEGQNAIKGAVKTVSRLRALMQKYYLSHPRCRFSLRILASPQKGGAKGRSEDTVYAPSKSVQEAVQKAVGKDVATSCEWIDTSSAAYAEALAEDDMEDGDEESPITLEAFLPKAGADPAVVSKKPQCTHFIFVDFRSVSCARGTLKQIHTLYKSYLKSASSSPGFSDPFMYLNIRCPPGAYDPNIEPTKDDVLFHNRDAVIKTVEKMLKRFYGELKIEERASKRKAVEVVKQSGFELLLARKPPAPAPDTAPPAPKEQPTPVHFVRPPEITDYDDDLDEDEEELAAMAVDTVMGQGPVMGGFVPVNSPVAIIQKQTESLIVEDEDQPMPLADDLAPANDGAPKETNEPEPAPETAAPNTNAASTTLVTPQRKSTWGFNMSDGLDEDDDDEPMVLEQHASDNEETVRKDITLSNPWTTAKINAPITSSPAVSSAHSSPLPELQHSSRPLRTFRPPARVGLRSGSSSVSPQNAGDGGGGFPTPASSPAARMFRENRGSVMWRPRPEKKAGGNAEVMDSWISRAPRGENEGEGGGAQTKSKSTSFVSAAKVYKEHINGPPDDDSDGEDQEGGQQKEKHPVRVREVTKRAKTGGDAPKRRRLDPEGHENGFTPINDLGDDYDLGPAPTRQSPHRNRFLAAAAALNPAKQPPVGEDVPLLPPPERRLKKRRTKTLLPLDIVPEPFLQTHMLSKTVDLVSGGKLRGMFKALERSDEYVGGTASGMVTERGKEVEGMFFSESVEWDEVEMLGGLLKEWLMKGAERAGLMGEVEGMGWVWGEGEGEEGGRVLCALGVGDVEDEVMQE